jgi:DnaJ-like protein
MSFGKIVEALIKEAQERGEFGNLPGKGKPIDLTSYFESPEDVRAAQSVLKNVGMTSLEGQLLKGIAELRQAHTALVDEKKKAEIQMQIQEKQMEFNLMIERQKGIGKPEK